jgi:hypothetical protein
VIPSFEITVGVYSSPTFSVKFYKLKDILFIISGYGITYSGAIPSPSPSNEQGQVKPEPL